MSRQLPNPGTYQARRSGPIVVREEESGALMAYIPYALCNADVAYSGTHSLCLGAKDGTVMKKSVETLMKIFPAEREGFSWDGLNPFDLEEIPLPEGTDPEFELADCYHDDTYIPEGKDEPVIQFKAEWLNPLGGGFPSKEPMSPEERKASLARWGGKFKAVNGKAAPAGAKKEPAAPSRPSPSRPAAAPSRPAVGGPPSRRGAAPAAARTATAEGVWMDFKKANKGESDEDLTVKFYAAQDEVAPNANGELTPTQWGKVADNLGV